MSELNARIGRTDPRRDDRNCFIYLAQAIDLDRGGEHPMETSAALHIAAQQASEYLQMPVFDPKGAWSRSLLLPGPYSNPGRNALVGMNQTLALAANLLIAVFDLDTPSWGMPYEVLSRAEVSNKPILVVCRRPPDSWPMYLQWVLGGNATWICTPDLMNANPEAVIAQALERLGLGRVGAS